MKSTLMGMPLVKRWYCYMETWRKHQNNFIGASFCKATILIVGGVVLFWLGATTFPISDQARTHNLKPRKFLHSTLKMSSHVRFCHDLPSEFRLGVSDFLHLMRMFGPSELVSVQGVGDIRLVDVFLSDEISSCVFGQAAMVVTPFGIRFPIYRVSSGETHRDQCLAVFAEVGLPLDTEIVVNGVPYVIEDILNDSVANFHLDQLELAWTAQAYGAYILPFQTEWKNRFGRAFNVTELAMELMRRPLEYQSCGGTHSLMALSYLSVQAKNYQCWSEHFHEKVTSFIRFHVDEALENQGIDGRWQFPWGSESLEAYQDVWNLMLATSHTHEWLASLSHDIDVPKDALDRSKKWLVGTLDKVPAAERRTHFCPWSHAVEISYK